MIEVTPVELNAVRTEVTGKTLAPGSRLQLARISVGARQPLGLSYDLEDGTQVSKLITPNGNVLDLPAAP